MPILRRGGISGEYRGSRQGGAVVLRVDVGAQNSLDIISGDFLSETNPGEFSFHHSFQTTALVLEDGPDAQTLRGPVKVHREDILDIARIDLRIPDEGELLVTYTFYRLTQFGRQTAATLTFPLTKTANFFRQVEVRVDQVEGIPQPTPFQTGSHPQTPTTFPPRTLTFQAAYADVGVNLIVTSGEQAVPVNLAGTDGLWTDEELHAAMVNQFEEHEDVTQWRLYLLLATTYIEGGVLGIMFDSGDDFPRQGAAIFANHPAIRNAAEVDRPREYLYTIVHELGHAFNMLHSFQKGIFDTHGVLPRTGSLSWMNYPQLFPYGYAGPDGWNGSTTFWSQFTFGFDHDEIAHIRHNDSMEVIMGGRSFGFAGHLEERPFEIPTRDRELSLVLWLPEIVEFLQQVEGDIRLRNDSQKTITVPSILHPAAGSLELLVRRPGDRYPKVYRHFTNLCPGVGGRSLPAGEALYQELSPSFGLRHWFIDEPGTYEVQTIYHGVDGSRLNSNVRRLRVLLPKEEADRLAPDFFTTDTGMYLGVEGSRVKALGSTRDMLDKVRERIPKALITKQVNIVNALRDTRVFKDVYAGKVVEPESRTQATDQLLKALDVSKTKKTIRVDPSQAHLRVSRYLQYAAESYVEDENKASARNVIDTIEGFLSDVNAPPKATQEVRSLAKRLRLGSSTTR